MTNSKLCVFYRGQLISFACKLTGGTAQTLKVYVRMMDEPTRHEMTVTSIGNDTYTATLDTLSKDLSGKHLLSFGVYRIQAWLDGNEPTDIEERGFEIREPL